MFPSKATGGVAAAGKTRPTGAVARPTGASKGGVATKPPSPTRGDVTKGDVARARAAAGSTDKVLPFSPKGTKQMGAVAPKAPVSGKAPTPQGLERMTPHATGDVATSTTKAKAKIKFPKNWEEGKALIKKYPWESAGAAGAAGMGLGEILD